MRKILLMCITTLCLSMLYVMPSYAKAPFVLYAGVEEVFDILNDRDTNEEHFNDNLIDQTEYHGWITARVNIRKEPNTDSEILGVLEFNETITYQYYNNKWAIINYNNDYAYVCLDFISKDKLEFEEFYLPENSGFKSYMSYEAITNKHSKQYVLQKYYAYTGNYGIRMIHNRYCIALGTYFNAPIGTYVDLVLENGITISCVVSEVKANQDTNEDNIVTSHNGCVSEFLVDVNIMSDDIKSVGDISSCDENWNSPVTRVKVYNKKIIQ